MPQRANHAICRLARHTVRDGSPLQRGGCDDLCARRAGCRRRRAGAARRPSPVGSTHRPFTARLAGALVERLAGELPATAQATAPADEQRTYALQSILAALPEDDRGTTLLLAAREGLTPEETAPAGVSVSETGSRAVALRRGSAPTPSWSWRRLPRHRSAKQARNSPPVRTSPGEDADLRRRS